LRIAAIVPVNDIDIAIGVDGERIQVLHRRLGSWAAIARISGPARSRHRGDDLGDFVDAPDGVVAPVADVQVAVDIECAAVRLTDQTLDGWTSVTGIAFLAGADNGSNLSYLKFHIC
jgi:hypothetical protein